MTNATAPGAERISSSPDHKKEEGKGNTNNNRFNASSIMNSGGYNGFGGGGGNFQLPQLPQLQYNQSAGNHVCCGANTSTTEVDSSKFLSAIVGKSNSIRFTIYFYFFWHEFAFKHNLSVILKSYRNIKMFIERTS